MGKDIQSHTEWCIIRFSNGVFERARDGYKSAENAKRGIPSAAREFVANGGSRDATYAIGSYSVGMVVVRSGFARVSAA